MEACHITKDVKRVEWVRTPSMGIRKTAFSFAVKLLSLLVWYRLSSTQANNMVTWDWAMILATILAGLEIDFARILIVEIHKRPFKATTTLSFQCLIFNLFMDASVLVWYYDRFLEETKTMDISLIQKDAY